MSGDGPPTLDQPATTPAGRPRPTWLQGLLGRPAGGRTAAAAGGLSSPAAVSPPAGSPPAGSPPAGSPPAESAPGGSGVEPHRPSRQRGRRWGLVLVLVTLGVLLGFRVLEPSQVWVMVGLLALCGVALWTTPTAWERLLNRVGKVTVGSVTVEMANTAKEAAGAAGVDPADEPDVADEPDPGDDLYQLRLSLQAKLTYLAKHVLVSATAEPTPQSDATFLTIGSLRHDGLLTAAEAKTADTILTTSATIPPGAATTEFVVAARQFVKGFRATVFRAYVRTVIEGYGHRVELVQRGEGRRDDLLTTIGGQVRRIAPVFAQRPDSPLVTARLAKFADEGTTGWVVLPVLDVGDHPIADCDVLTLGDLRAELQKPTAAGRDRHGQEPTTGAAHD